MLAATGALGRGARLCFARPPLPASAESLGVPPHRSWLLRGLASGALLPACWADRAAALSADEKQATKMFDRNTPGVVSISKDPAPAQAATISGDEGSGGSIQGSGFVWDDKHVVTNSHVIQGINKPYITFVTPDPKTGKPRRTTLDAVVVGSDSVSDVAVLRVGARTRDQTDSIPPNLMQALLRGTSNNLLVGQNVFAFGNPFGLEHSLSRGIISGLSRKMEGAGGRPISGVIQTDASINPGNSGGPLLNSEGKVIGVNTAILTGSGTFAGVGLAIPIDLVQKNVDSIIAKGFVRRPVLGIVFAPDVMALELQLPGIMVMKVVPGGPAETAGVRSMRGGRLGDVVLGMEGKKVTSTDDLFGILEQKAPGDEITLTVQRATTDVESDKTEEKVLKVILGAADAPKA